MYGILLSMSLLFCLPHNTEYTGYDKVHGSANVKHRDASTIGLTQSVEQI